MQSAMSLHGWCSDDCTLRRQLMKGLRRLLWIDEVYEQTPQMQISLKANAIR
jgi:hypothetical protein